MNARYSPPRTIIVTGGSAGVGRAIANRFAQNGDRVGVISRDEAALAATRDELLASGAAMAAYAVADVANSDEVFAAAELLEAELGALDIWVNDAMETVFSTVADITPQEFQRVTEVTYLGFVYGSMAALKSMRRRGQGRIVQIGSALAYRGIPLQSAYCGAKHAIRGFSEFAAHGADARGARHRRHHDRPARRQHAAVRLGARASKRTPRPDWPAGAARSSGTPCSGRPAAAGANIGWVGRRR